MDFILKKFTFIIFLYFIFLFKSIISIRIDKIVESISLPSIFDANEDYLNILSIGKIFVLNKEDNTIKYNILLALFLHVYYLKII